MLRINKNFLFLLNSEKSVAITNVNASVCVYVCKRVRVSKRASE